MRMLAVLQDGFTPRFVHLVLQDWIMDLVEGLVHLELCFTGFATEKCVLW